MVVGHHLHRGPLEYWEEALALNKDITWDALKKGLINKYKCRENPIDFNETMVNRKFVPGETFTEYYEDKLR